MPSINGLPYPALSDPNNPPADFLALATAVDGKLNALDGSKITTGTVSAARLPNLENLNGTLDIASGGTGAATVAGARAVLLTGSVLQVKTAFYSSQVTNSTAHFVNTGLSVSITPTSSTSKILVIVNQNGVAKAGGNSNSGVGLALFRNSTEIIRFEQSAGITYTSVHNHIGSASTVYLDSPATTSEITYKTMFYNDVGAASAAVQNAGGQSSIALLEIGG